MGTMNDPKVKAAHDQIQQAFYYTSKPNFAQIFNILNGMSMQDMCDELYRQSGRIGDLAQAVMSATGVNVPRLRAAIGAFQDPPPSDWNALIQKLPADQQQIIQKVKASSGIPNTPTGITPGTHPQYYDTIRTLPPLKITARATAPSAAKPGSKDDKCPVDPSDDNAAKLAFDFATGLTANAPSGKNPTTYSFTLIYRNFDILSGKNGKCDEFAFFHEPNVTLGISPDPQNRATYQAAFSLFNAHLKRNWGLISPDVEFSVSPQITGSVGGGAPSGTMQAQLELHVTGTVSITIGSSITVGPKSDTPDRGSINLKNGPNVDISVIPIQAGTLWHF